MGKLFSFWSGNKTYFIAIIGAVLGILTSQGVEIPEWVWMVGGALGLGTLRAAIPPKP